MEIMTPKEKVLIEYLFKYVELSKSLLEAAIIALQCPRNEDSEKMLDLYKANMYLNYQDNYEELAVAASVIKDRQAITHLDTTWNWLPQGKMWQFSSDKLKITVNIVNINFIDPLAFATFISASIPEQQEFQIDGEEMTTLFRIFVDKKYLIQTEIKLDDKAWQPADYMLNYDYFLELAKANIG